MKLTMKQAQKQFSLYPQTKKALTAWEIDSIADIAGILNVDHNVKQAAQGIMWAISTGRISGTTDIAIRQMSTYQTLKLLVDVVNNTNTQNEVPSYLNRKLN